MTDTPKAAATPPAAKPANPPAAQPASPPAQAPQGQQQGQKPDSPKPDAPKPAGPQPVPNPPAPAAAPKEAPKPPPAANTPPVAKPPAPNPPAQPAPAQQPPAAKPAQQPPAPQPPGPTPAPLRPMARPARMKRRHRGLIFSLILLVLIPFGATTYYLWGIAQDQYSSVAGFTVRKEDGGGASDLIGGLAALTGGGSAAADGDILYEFILSQALVRTIDEMVDLRGHYASNWEIDPVFSLWPDASIEDLEHYWQRIVRIGYDQGSGLTEVRVLAFDPEMAQTIVAAILKQSQDMINALNEQAREDSMRYARLDLAEAVTRLKTAREALTAFRIRTQIVEPEADLQGRMGVVNNLQQQLAQALIELDLLRETTSDSDPRTSQARRKITVIRDRIRDERASFATETTENTPSGEDYPSLIAEYEGLVVDREFAEESYRAALTALDIARAQASRQSRYLATYVRPTIAETSEFPRRITIAGIVGLFLLLSWSVLILIYYSLRDRQ